MAAYREKRAGSVEVEGEEVGVVVSVALQEPRCRSCRYAVASASFTSPHIVGARQEWIRCGGSMMGMFSGSSRQGKRCFGPVLLSKQAERAVIR